VARLLWLQKSTNSSRLSRAAEYCAQSHSLLVTQWCIDTAKALRRDAFLAMIRLLSLPPIEMKATAHAIPVAHQGVEAGSDEDGSMGAVAAACGNVETDAAGTCRVAGRRRKDPLIH
jgi:hypothetical protein